MIPATAHFIWFGRQFPWVNALAIRSTALRGELDRVVLHHSDDLSGTPWWHELQALPSFESRLIDASSTLRPFGQGLEALFAKLTSLTARANVLRVAILAAEGGIYLDLDVITLRSLQPLLSPSGAFLGSESVVWPGTRQWRDPLFLAQAGLREAARECCRLLPNGWRTFRRIEHRYHRAANNAVLGARPGHHLMLSLLDRMQAMSPEQQVRQYALGTHLLQQQLAQGECHDTAVHPPAAFYPFAPQISQHLFRMRDRLDESGVDLPGSYLVHWYASVRMRDLIPQITPDYVRRNSERQYFSQLALPLLESSPIAAAA